MARNFSDMIQGKEGGHTKIDSLISSNNLKPSNILNQVKSKTLDQLQFLIDAVKSKGTSPYLKEEQHIGWTGHERGQVDVGENKTNYPSFGFWGEDYLRRESKNGELDKNWISKNMSINPKVPKPYGTYSVKSSTGMPENQEYRDLYKLFQKIVPISEDLSEEQLSERVDGTYFKNWIAQLDPVYAKVRE